MKNMKKRIRKIFTFNNRAVSPIIAVILMVAITVVLAATIYVWISAFGSGDGGTDVMFSLKQVTHGTQGTMGYVEYEIESVNSHPGYEQLAASLDGEPATLMKTLPANPDGLQNCSGEISGGDRFYVITTQCTGDQLPGKQLNIEHTSSSTLIVSLQITYRQ